MMAEVIKCKDGKERNKSLVSLALAKCANVLHVYKTHTLSYLSYAIIIILRYTSQLNLTIALLLNFAIL